MNCIIKTTNLTKKYGRQLVVDNISLNVGKGDIYAYLGHNGAGKTTTISMLLGLAKPTSGDIKIFGEPAGHWRNRNLERIGVLLDSPSFYPNLTAFENLDIHQRLIGVVNRGCLEEELHNTGLLEFRNKKVGDFSFGMIQRLGIARAMLHNPEILILDEPTRGLDPIGIKEVRGIISDLSQKRHITFFLSSHILSEVQQIATRIGIIHMGKLLEEIDYNSLKAKNRSYLSIIVDDDKKASMLLEQKLGITDYTIVCQGVMKVYEQLDLPERISSLFVSYGLSLKEITLKSNTLEDYFIKLTGRGFGV